MQNSRNFIPVATYIMDFEKNAAKDGYYSNVHKLSSAQLTPPSGDGGTVGRLMIMVTFLP